ncbi:MAG: AsmA-like C-terminal region-containing protein [Desulfobulbaceae bacterium]|nr:AsmA-like C-terminal region-containing protein [Desulfobulbaceae bacterium]
MTKRKKVMLLLAGVFWAVIFLVVGLFFFASSILKTDAIQTQAVNLLQRVTGADLSVRYAGAQIRILPIPQLSLHHVDFGMSGKIRGQIDAVAMHPEILPLFKGTFRISQINLRKPSFTLELSKKAETATTIESIQQQGVALVRQLTAFMPGLVIGVEEGRLELTKDNTEFSINDINLNLVLSPKQLEADLKCSSEIWHSLSASLLLHPESMSGYGSLQVRQFSLAALPALSRIIPGVHITEGDVDITSSLDIQNLNQARISIAGSLPAIVLAKSERTLALQEIGFQSALTLDPKTISVQLQELTFHGPLRSLSGTYQQDRTTGARRITVTGDDIDIPEFRRAALRLGDDVLLIHRVFEILQAGVIPSLTLNSSGMTYAELVDPDHLDLSGELLNGNVAIPKLGLDFLDVAGNFAISSKILSASKIEASLDNHRCRQGKLQIGLNGNGDPFHADLTVEADVGQVPELLKRVNLLPKGNLQQELDRMNLKGRIVGRLLMGERLNELNGQIDLSNMEFSVRTKTFPVPLTVTEGKMHLDKQGVEIMDVAGTFGKSSLSGVTAKIGMTKPYPFTIDHGQGVFDLEELYPWVTSVEPMKSTAKEVRKASGVLAVSSLSLKGPLRKPREWQYTLKGEARQCRLETPFLPGNVNNLTGAFHAVPGRVSVQDASCRVADSMLASSSGEFATSSSGALQKAEISLQGEIGPQLGAWLLQWQRAKLPQALMIREPITIQKSSFSWEKGMATSILGNVRLAEKINVSFELLKTDNEVVIRDLKTKDDISDATASISFGKEEVSGSFKGQLSGKTLDAILPENHFPGARLQGDCRFRVPRANLVDATFVGNMTLTDMPVPWKRDVPLVVKEINVQGAEKKITIVASTILLGDERLSVRGTVSSALSKASVDLDVAAEVLDWRVIKQLSQPTGVGTQTTGRSWLEDPPVLGTIKGQAKAFHFGKYTLSPFSAIMSLQKGGFTIALKKSVLCGISSQGTFAVTAGGAEADIKLSAQDIDLEPSALCLTDHELDVTGTFSLDANLKGKGAVDKIADWLQGPVTVSATKGYILRSNLMSKTLKMVNTTGNFRNTLPNIERGAIAYSDITATGTLQGPVFALQLGTLSSDFVDIGASGQIHLDDGSLHVKGLVAPLHTVDRIVQGAPFLGRVLGGNLTALPVRIGGTVNDIKMDFISPGAIGSELIGIIERTVKLPVMIVEPVFPTLKGNKDPGN